MPNLDVLFVNPNSARQVYQDLADDYAAIEPPVWSLLLAESCRSVGFEVGILDCDAERLTTERAAERIRKLNPRMACFVVYGQNPNSGTTNMAGAVPLCDAVKEVASEIKTCFVGSHTQALPREVLAIPSVDFVLLNEGVRALRNLLKTDLVLGLAGVKGIGYKKLDTDGSPSFFLTSPEPPISHVEMGLMYPGMAWDLLPFREKPLDLYRAHNWFPYYGSSDRSPYAALYTSLGCPFKCQFCMINLINRVDNTPNVTAADSAKFRYWPAAWVMKQLAWLNRNGVKTVRFSDEMFFFDQRHYLPLLEEICREYEDSFNFWAYARVDTVRTRHLKLFREAGVRWLCLGIESANQTIRRQVTKGSYEEVDIRQVVKEVEDAGIEVIANYIFGLPSDTKETMEETLKLSIELNTSMWNAYPAMALPGSPLYMNARQRGIPLPDTYSGFSFHSYDCLPMPTDSLSAAEVLKFRDEAFQKYWNRPEFLTMIEGKFGAAARQNIEGLVKVKLKRKILGD